MQRRAAARDGDSVLAANVVRKFLFKRRNRFAERAGDLARAQRRHDSLDLFLAEDGLENLDHELLLTSTLILSFSAPRKGPCLTLMHCMSSSTRTACVP